MFAGNIGAAQSFETILDTAVKLKDYPEIQWIIFGDGRLRRWIEQHVEQLGLEKKVHLMGTRTNEEMPRYLSLADSLMVTLRREEIFSLTIPGKVQSYLACGRPIVAALDGEGARVVRESEAGLVVPAQDADALAAAVLEMYRMPPGEREEMGRRGESISRNTSNARSSWTGSKAGCTSWPGSGSKLRVLILGGDGMPGRRPDYNDDAIA